MIFGRLHLVDLAVVVARLVAVILVGKRAAGETSSEEVGFLACCPLSGAIVGLFVLLLRFAT
jgi:hypothetical protein